MSQIVDTVTAKEFMGETMDKIDEKDLVAVSDALAIKSQKFQKAFGLDFIDSLSEEDFYEVLKLNFAIKSKSRKALKEIDFIPLRNSVKALIHGDDKLQNRFQTFVEFISGLPAHIRYDLAGELLHYTFPDRYWLWSHWMWNPKLNTGSLPLVTTEEFDMNADTIGESYMKVGQAIAFIHEVGEAAGFQTISRNLYGTNVYLSCVYVIYAYTVLKMRMTKEFNQVMPGVVEFSGRILGVYRLMEVKNRLSYKAEYDQKQN